MPRVEFDIFFSICQTEVDGYLPDERTMLANFFEQVELADRLGFGTASSGWAHRGCEADSIRSAARRTVRRHDPADNRAMTATGMSQPVGLERITIRSVTSPFARYPSRPRFRREKARGSISS